MYKEVIETKIMQTIGDYTIVKSVEQNYWDDGTRAGRMHNHYDVCLDGGNGDIVASFDKLNEARKWAREDVKYRKEMCKDVDYQNIPENGFKSMREVNAFYRNIDGKKLNKIYEEYYGKETWK
jgi:hypothetical protein